MWVNNSQKNTTWAFYSPIIKSFLRLTIASFRRRTAIPQYYNSWPILATIMWRTLKQVYKFRVLLLTLSYNQSESIIAPENYLVVRVDGHGFTKLSTFFTHLHWISSFFFRRLCAQYKFEKPNDDRALGLMNASAIYVMERFPDITFAYGQSDEYSFLFPKNTKSHQRRSTFVSLSVFDSSSGTQENRNFGSILLLISIYLQLEQVLP